MNNEIQKLIDETDANKRKITKVRDMKKSQLGYFGQDISVLKVKMPISIK